MKLTTKPKYIEPYPQEALDGEMGLTAADIALGLGVNSADIRRKIKRIGLKKDEIFNTCQMTRVNSATKKPYIDFVLNVAAAKYFVATWKNEMGIGYFKYLLECERIVQEELPLLKKKIEAFEQWTVKKTKKRTFMVRTMAFIQKGLFGDEIEVVKETKPYQDLSEDEKRAWKFKHRSKIAEGLNKKNNDELTKGKVIPISSAKLLGK